MKFIKKSSEKMSCRQCTFKNEPLSTLCIMCGNVLEQKLKWVCEKCTFDNDIKDTKCGMCESTKIVDSSRNHDNTEKKVIINEFLDGVVNYFFEILENVIPPSETGLFARLKNEVIPPPLEGLFTVLSKKEPVIPKRNELIKELTAIEQKKEQTESTHEVIKLKQDHKRKFCELQKEFLEKENKDPCEIGPNKHPRIISQKSYDSKIFDKMATLYLMLESHNEYFNEAFCAASVALGIPKHLRENFKHHLSILKVHINLDHPGAKIIFDLNDHDHKNHKKSMIINKRLVDELENICRTKLHGISFVSTLDDYAIRGRYFTKSYYADTNDNTFVTDIRKVFYAFIEKSLGPFTSRTLKSFGEKKCYVYEYINEPLLAVPEYYHGIGTVTPHVSLEKLSVIKQHNLHLYNEFIRHGINVLIKKVSYALRHTNKINTRSLHLKCSASKNF